MRPEQSVKLLRGVRPVSLRNLHPYADKVGELPHNLKVFNLCLINKMGLENWAASKASEVRKVYFTKPWTLS